MSETHIISRFDGDVRWVSVTTASCMLDVSRQRVYQLISSGALVSLKDVNTVLVSVRSVQGRMALQAQEEEESHAVR